MLTWAYSFDVDPRGNIYVADRWVIRVFAPDGRLVRNIGRQGNGPGEFGTLSSVELMPGDSLYAFDGELSRVTVFEPGSWRAAYTTVIGRSQIFPPIGVHRVRGGRAISAWFTPAYGDFDDREINGRRKTVFRLLNPDGSVSRDSVLAVAERENLMFHNPEGASGDNPFGRTTNVAFASGDRMVVQWSDSLRFDLYSVDGKHLKTVHGAYFPRRRPITSAERDSVIASLADNIVPAASVRRAVEEHGATTWPLVVDMIVDDQDRIWVGLTGGRGEPHHWVAFDMDGNAVAQVDLPVTSRLRLVRGSTAYVVALDDNDVPQVVVYDLKPASTPTTNRR